MEAYENPRESESGGCGSRLAIDKNERGKERETEKEGVEWNGERARQRAYDRGEFRVSREAQHWQCRLGTIFPHFPRCAGVCVFVYLCACPPIRRWRENS